MKNQFKHIYKLIVCLMAAGLLLFAKVDMNTVYAKKISLNKSKLTLSKGATYKLKLKNTKKKAKWSSNNKSVAAVNSKGVVKAKKKGTAVITARLGGKKYKCSVVVKKSLSANAQEKEVLALINEQREKRGLAPLKMDGDLQKAAKKRAKELSVHYSHSRPNGKDALSILSEYNIRYSSAGENIAAGYASPEEVVKGWMSSEGHRENILRDRYSKIGIGYVKASDSEYTYYWVQLFTN